jgi:hypothetical protein
LDSIAGEEGGDIEDMEEVESGSEDDVLNSKVELPEEKDDGVCGMVPIIEEGTQNGDSSEDELELKRLRLGDREMT